MPTFLFDEIIFGPVTSRRLGRSLGINLLPTNRKVCNFNCIYCECGLTLKEADAPKGKLPARSEIYHQLESKLLDFKKSGSGIDTITYAGNGEPTMHPEFLEIIEDTCTLRDKHFPEVKIAVLTNATLLASKKIQKALSLIDYNILKLDSVFSHSINTINAPLVNYDIEKTIELLKPFCKTGIIQTLFLQGTLNGQKIDNTTELELAAWYKAIEGLKPSMVMIYTIARDTPYDSLHKVPLKKLEEIANQVRSMGIEAQVSG